jgi:hypothetical protein
VALWIWPYYLERQAGDMRSWAWAVGLKFLTEYPVQIVCIVAQPAVLLRQRDFLYAARCAGCKSAGYDQVLQVVVDPVDPVQDFDITLLIKNQLELFPLPLATFLIEQCWLPEFSQSLKA